MQKKCDPFNLLPEEICDEIASYLDVRDIKEASLVSKQWYYTIGKSKVCMKKVRLRVNSEKFEFYTSILESSRSYQHLVMTIPLNKLKKNTKYLRVIREIVTKFAETLVSIKTSHDLRLNVDLPKLKELEYAPSNYDSLSLIAANGIATKTKGLEKLTVKCRDMDKKSIRYLKDFLMENDSLKVLSIGDNRLIHGLNSDNLKFKLEEFYMNIYAFREFPNSHDFYNTHTSSLKIVDCLYTKDDVANVMSNFPKLNTLTIDPMNWQKEISPEFPLNTTITKLKLKVSSYDIYQRGCGPPITEILKKLQNLQELEIGHISSQILRTLLNCQSLKIVKFHDYSDLSDLDLYEMERQENIEFTKVVGYQYY